MSPTTLAPARKRQQILSRLNLHPQQGRFVPLAVFLVALLVRLGPLLWNSGLRFDSGQYDDGVYFAAAQHLVLGGQVPYRDFVLLHPPGIVLAMAPFAALSHFIGDANAFAAARLLLILVGAVNAALVAWIAGRQGVVAGAAGGLLYAVWWAAVSAETTVFLEPILNLLLLLSVGLLTSQRPSPRRIFIAGLLMGASVGFKLWPLPVLLLLVGWLFRTSGPRAAGRFSLGCALSLVAIFGPFFAIAPRQMWNLIVIAQTVRPRDALPGQSISERLLSFAGASDHLDNVVPAALVFLVAAAVITSIILLVRTVPHGLLWCGIFCIQVVELLIAPIFYGTHYPNFAAASFAVLVGFAVARGLELLEHGRTRRHGRRRGFVSALTTITLLTLLLILFASSMAIGMKRANEWAVNVSALRSFTHRYQCVWTTTPIVAIIADQDSRNIEHGCDYQVDRSGLFLADSSAAGDKAKFASFPTLAVWQRQIQEELSHSDAAVVAPEDLQYRWSATTREDFMNRFKNVGHLGSLQLWSAKE